MSETELAITGGQVAGVHSGPATVLVNKGRIVAVQAAELPINSATVIDATGMLVLPGAIDIHFHCRDPSYAHRGDFATETRAAAAGGVTTIFEMPISKPSTSTLARWLERRDIAASKAYVNIGLYAAPGLLEAAEVEALAEAGAIGFKLFTTSAVPGREDEFEGLSTENNAQVFRALEAVQRTGLRCVFHAEDQSLIDEFSSRIAGSNIPVHHFPNASRPAVAEAVAVAAIVQMAIATECPVHIAHVSSAASVQVVRQAKQAGAPITAETCPHYLFSTEEDLERVGPFGFINPPLRSAADQAALWEALADGTLDVVATDHAPFTREEKEAPRSDLRETPPGHPGVETLVPLLMTAVAQGRLSLEKVVDLISVRPAQLFGLNPAKGSLAPGSDADITIYDPRQTRIIQRGEGESRAADCNLLYAGMEVNGKVHATVVNGELAYLDGQVVGRQGAGKIVSPARARVADWAAV